MTRQNNFILKLLFLQKDTTSKLKLSKRYTKAKGQSIRFFAQVTELADIYQKFATITKLKEKKVFVL